ncbi:MAG: hypothetical protein WHT46_02870 [Candidatus Geothermincolales bacterium]
MDGTRRRSALVNGITGIFWALALTLTLIALFGAVGCGGGKKDTVVTGEGESFEGEEDGQRISVRREPPSLDEIGLPLYPGSEYVEGSGGSYVAAGDRGNFESKSIAYRTTDPFDKVLQWYRERLGDPTAQYSTESEREAHWSINEGENVTLFLSLRGAQGIVLIEMGRLSGSPAP